MRSSRHVAPAPLLAFLVAALAVLGMWRQTEQSGAIDFYQFWVVGRALEEHPNVDPYAETGRARLGNLYLKEALELGATTSKRHRDVAQFRRVLGNYSTPALYALFSVLESGDFERDARRFELVSAGALVLGLLLLARLLRYSWTAVGLLIALVTPWFAPLASDLGVMNVNRLQLGTVALVAWLAARGGSRLVVAAALLGAAVLVKPNLAFAALGLTLALAFERRWRALLGWAGGGILGALVAFGGSLLVWGGAEPWSRWRVAVTELLGDWSSHTIEWGNYATGLALSQGTGVEIPGLVWIGLGLFLAALAVGCRAPSDDNTLPIRGPRTALALGAGLAVGLVGARLTWLHYDLLALPLILVLWRRRGDLEAPSRRALRVGFGTLGFLGLALRPVQALGLADTPLQQALVVNAGLLALFAGGLIEIARGADYGDGPQDDAPGVEAA